MFDHSNLAGQCLIWEQKLPLPGLTPVLPPLHHISSKEKEQNPNHMHHAGFQAYCEMHYFVSVGH